MDFLKQIYIFGDSIVFGQWDIERGWVARLQTFAAEKRHNNYNYLNFIYNLGVPGNTTRDLVDRFHTDIQPRIRFLDKAVIFSIGLNDSAFNPTRDNENHVTLDMFRSNIRILLDYARRYTTYILFLGLLPVDEKRCNQGYSAYRKSYSNVHIDTYNQSLKEACLELGVDFLNLNQLFRKTHFQNMLFDGVHPNSSGHEIIFREVKDYLLKRSLL